MFEPVSEVDRQAHNQAGGPDLASSRFFLAATIETLEMRRRKTPRATSAHGAPSSLSSALNFTSDILPPLVAVNKKEQKFGAPIQKKQPHGQHRRMGHPRLFTAH